MGSQDRERHGPGSQRRVVRILIGTVGGQGGGLLTNWLVRGFYYAGWFAQSIGVLGLAQRSGTVTYYVEAKPGLERPMISVYAHPGDVDLVVGQELLELGRLLRGGFAAPGCTIIGNVYRYYATLEKMPAGDGTYPVEQIMTTAKQLTDDVYLLDAAATVRALGLPELTSNALLLGMMVASRKLRLAPEPFRRAIEESGVDAERNLRSFDEGYRLVSQGGAILPPPVRKEPVSWRDRAAELEARLTGSGQVQAYRRLLRGAEETFGGWLMPILAEAVYRLLDYQDARYVDEYTERVRGIWEAERRALPGGEARDWPVTRYFARHLAVWMTYEDAPRVAQLKIRRERFRKIKENFGIKKGQKFVVTEYLDPDGPQLYGILPARLVRALIGKQGERFKRLQNVKFPMRLKSTSVTGYALLKLIAGCRAWRRRSYRHRQEMEMMERWEAAVYRALREWPSLAEFAAQAGDLVKGYAHVRERALQDLWMYVERILPRVARLDQEGAADGRAVAQFSLKIAGREAGKGGEALSYVEDVEKEKRSMRARAVSTTR
ncbi:MAG: indolepyruvate oxidoreductase subunit beta family protein [Kyrpidia tusciae]|nr:indolepyruvate oxidoreductase subunit beta family protein [Kyrpidia tusciae]MBE3551692.1 indolepyruvate oxidoreductase subunit beta family protein [Kyrpidia tusciae]